MTDPQYGPSSLLTPEEIDLVARAVMQWGGPAHASDDLARAMGFVDAETMLIECSTLRRKLRADTPLISAEWARVLVAAEIAFASDLFGAGTEWRTTTGDSDEDTIRRLRTIQRKLGPVLRPHYGGRNLL